MGNSNCTCESKEKLEEDSMKIKVNPKLTISRITKI